jgi:kynurenine formamidase
MTGGPFGFLTREKVLQAVQVVRTGEVISLDLPLDGPPLVPGPAGRPELVHTPRMHNEVRPRGRDGYVVVNDDVIQLSMQGSSHWDALAHWGGIEPGDDSVFFGGATMTETFPEFGAKTLGIGLLGGAVVTRGVLIDLVEHVHGPDAHYLADGVKVDRALVEEALERRSVDLTPGDAVCFRTGFHTRLREVRQDAAPLQSPGLEIDTLDLFAEAGTFALISDNPSVEPIPMPTGRFHTVAMKHLGIHLGELWALDALADACRRDGRYEFLLVSSPLSVARAFGSPANAVAIR